jgi:hypothetical protein
MSEVSAHIASIVLVFGVLPIAIGLVAAVVLAGAPYFTAISLVRAGLAPAVAASIAPLPTFIALGCLLMTDLHGWIIGLLTPPMIVLMPLIFLGLPLALLVPVTIIATYCAGAFFVWKQTNSA